MRGSAPGARMLTRRARRRVDRGCKNGFSSPLQTPLVYGRMFEAGVTESSGAPMGVRAQLGYGRSGVDPRTHPGWSWFEDARARSAP